MGLYGCPGNISVNDQVYLDVQDTCWIVGLLWLLWVENACCKVSSLSSAFRLEYGCLPRFFFMLEWHPLLFTEGPILFCSCAKAFTLIMLCWIRLYVSEMLIPSGKCHFIPGKMVHTGKVDLKIKHASDHKVWRHEWFSNF